MNYRVIACLCYGALSTSSLLSIDPFSAHSPSRDLSKSGSFPSFGLPPSRAFPLYEDGSEGSSKSSSPLTAPFTKYSAWLHAVNGFYTDHEKLKEFKKEAGEAGFSPDFIIYIELISQLLSYFKPDIPSQLSKSVFSLCSTDGVTPLSESLLSRLPGEKKKLCLACWATLIKKREAFKTELERPSHTRTLLLEEDSDDAAIPPRIGRRLGRSHERSLSRATLRPLRWKSKAFGSIDIPRLPLPAAGTLTEKRPSIKHKPPLPKCDSCDFSDESAPVSNIYGVIWNLVCEGKRKELESMLKYTDSLDLDTDFLKAVCDADIFRTSFIEVEKGYAESLLRRIATEEALPPVIGDLTPEQCSLWGKLVAQSSVISRLIEKTPAPQTLTTCRGKE